MKILLYRFFINETEQLSLLNEPGKKRDKVGMVKDVLKKPYHFRYRKSELGYVCERCEDSFIYSKLGRRSTLAKILSPEADFRRELEEHWPYCRVFMRLDSDSKDGQIIAIEQQSNVFNRPLSPLQALTNQINETLSCEGYLLSVHPITSEKDFWALVKEGKREIQQLSLSFSSPNLFNIENALQEELRKLKREYNATETEISLANPIGNLNVSEKSKLVKEGVEYITKGGGEYKLKIRGTRYSSRDKSKHKVFDLKVDLESADKGTFIKTIKELTRE